MLSWGPKGQHVLDDASLWNFGGEDLEAAIMKTGYPKKKDSTERIDDLIKLIIGRFEKMEGFYTWSRSIHGEVIEDMPPTVERKKRKRDCSPPIGKLFQG